ncbi:MAG: OmpH family outer membrane protein [Sporomusaceae bacterium]|nr:OmpH family outer membrane protein [Sporomusaceae bacterium]
MLKNKKMLKMIALAVVAMFVLGVGGMAMLQTGTGHAAAPNSSIGKVNTQTLMTSHPDYAAAVEAMKKEEEQAANDFKEKTAAMNSDQEKQAYGAQLQQRLQMKEKELITAIQDKVNKAIKDVADAKGLTVVLPEQVVVYGGQDITQDVVKKFSK